MNNIQNMSWKQPKMYLPKKYTTVCSLPLKFSDQIEATNTGKRQSDIVSGNDILNLVPSPETVHVKSENEGVPSKKYMLGCLFACVLCFAVKNEKT